MPALDLAWIREQFPALALEIDGRPAVYLDGPGGTQVPRHVIQAISTYFVSSNANIHGTFLTSERTNAVVADAHAAMADLLGCDADEVVLGHNMTTLTFAMSRALGRELGNGDEIVVTRLDHDANVAPWQALAERGVTIRTVDIDVEDCTLDMTDLASKIGNRTRLVAIGYASNAVGTINDVATVVRMAHDVGALAFVDAVHYAPHGPIDVRALDCDFLVCSPYKFFAPHMGALYGKREHLLRLTPYKVRPAPDILPDRWETGTQNHEAQAGLAAAIGYLAELGQRMVPNCQGRRAQLQAAMDAIRTYERGLVAYLIAGLLRLPGLTFYGVSDPQRFDRRTPTVAVRVAGHDPERLSQELGKRGIFTWSGNYYALQLTERLGVEASGGMLRIGLMHYNTVAEVERFLDTFAHIIG